MMAAAVALAAGCCVPAGALGYNELALTVSGMPPQLIAGDLATLTVRVTNNDPLRTGNPIQLNFRALSDDPSGDLPTLSGAGCQSIVPPNVTCTVQAALPPGSTREFELTVATRDLGLVIVEAGAKAFVGDPEDFPLVELTAPPVRWEREVEPKADVKLDFTAVAETVASGGDATVRALVTNMTSSATAYGAVVKYSLPPEVQVVSKPEGCTGTALSLTCPVGDLGPQLTAERLLTFRSSQEGAFTVLGKATWAREDPTPIDTQGQATVTVLAAPDTSGTGVPAPASPSARAPKPKTVSASALAQGVPSVGRCVRSRRLNLVLRSRGIWDPIRATIRITGRRRALVLKGARAQRPFTLTLPRTGRVSLRLAVTLDNGRRYTATRSFRRC